MFCGLITFASNPEVDEWAMAEHFKQRLDVEWLNLTIDNNLNYVIAVFYSDTLKIDGKILPSEGNLDIFIAKFSPEQDLMWLKHAGGNNVDFSKFVNVDSYNNIYIQGMFRGTANFGQTELYSKTYEYFTAKFDDKGDMLWVKTRKTMMQNQNKSKKKSDYSYTQLPH